jgi:hypothetical protein
MTQAEMLSAEPVAVHRHASPGPGSVSTWILDGPPGVVIVDAQR